VLLSRGIRVVTKKKVSKKAPKKVQPKDYIEPAIVETKPATSNTEMYVAVTVFIIVVLYMVFG